MRKSVREKVASFKIREHAKRARELERAAQVTGSAVLMHRAAHAAGMAVTARAEYIPSLLARGRVQVVS